MQGLMLTVDMNISVSSMLAVLNRSMAYVKLEDGNRLETKRRQLLNSHIAFECQILGHSSLLFCSLSAA